MPTFVVGVDAGQASTRAVRFAAERVKVWDVDLVIVHIINWSPFSFNTPTENAERQGRRKAELAAAEEQVIAPMVALAQEVGVTAETVVRHGNPAETLIEVAKEKDAMHIIVGRTGESGLRETIFGSVVGRLVQNSPIPVTVVP